MRSYAVTASGTTNKDISVYIIPENSVMCKAADGGNTISEITASVVGVGVGDTITFTLGSCKVAYEIEAIIPTATWNGFFTTEDKFTDCYSTESVWVKTDSPQAVRDALNEVNGTAAAQTMEDRIAEVNNLISTSDSMKYTLMVFAILLSVVVLYNLSLLNVKERTRDMATLKVLGFDNFRIALALIVEILTLTLIGTAIGCLFGYPLMYLVMKLNEVAAMAFIYSITAASYFKAIAVSLGTSAFINILFGFLISKISMTVQDQHDGIPQERGIKVGIYPNAPSVRTGRSAKAERIYEGNIRRSDEKAGYARQSDLLFPPRRGGVFAHGASSRTIEKRRSLAGGTLCGDEGVSSQSDG